MKPLMQLRPKLAAPGSENLKSGSGLARPSRNSALCPLPSTFEIPRCQTLTPSSIDYFANSSFCRSESSTNLGQKQSFVSVPSLQISQLRLAVPNNCPNPVPLFGLGYELAKVLACPAKPGAVRECARPKGPPQDNHFACSSFCRSESSDHLGQKQTFASVPPLHISHFYLAVPKNCPNSVCSSAAPLRDNEQRTTNNKPRTVPQPHDLPRAHTRKHA